jgi:hypothetical protein
MGWRVAEVVETIAALSDPIPGDPLCLARARTPRFLVKDPLEAFGAHPLAIDRCGDR